MVQERDAPTAKQQLERSQRDAEFARQQRRDATAEADRIESLRGHPIRVALVGCGKSKLAHPAKAKDLYTGNLFRAARAYAERCADAWVVLSASYGALDPESMIQPYDRTLSKMRLGEQADYHRRVRSWLQQTYGMLDVTYVSLAGRDYVAGLGGLKLELPLDGMGLGERLAWLKQHTTSCDRTPRPSEKTAGQLDIEALLQRLTHHLASLYTATWVDQNPSLTRLIASMVVNPNTEEKRRPPDSHGIAVRVADQLKRAAPAEEKRYIDGWLAVNSSQMGLVVRLLWQARLRSWVPVKSGRITGERGTFRLLLGAQPARGTLPIESSLGWLRAVTHIREEAHPAPSIGSAVDYLEQFLSSEGLSAENLTPSSGRLYRDGAPFAIILATTPFEVWTVDRDWHRKDRLAPARYGRAAEGSR